MKTNEAKRFRLPGSLRLALCATLGALLAGACGGTVGKIPSIGSESHFLAYCADGCSPGLDCIGGICTRACLTDQSSCSDLATNAACTNQSVEPGEVAVCDVSCGSGGSCAALGADYACDHGYCRKPLSNGSAASGSAGAGGSSDCNPVGRYGVGKEGGYKPCCPGLTELFTYAQSYANGESTPTCVSPEYRSFSCIQGTCGDGICEDAEAPCGCGVDCPDSNWRTHPSECQSFRDQSPPPDIREISITNTGSVPLYIRVSHDCPAQQTLFEVQRDGQKLNVSPSWCFSNNCELVMDQGWPFGTASKGGLCASDCNSPAPVLIEPGRTWREALQLEYATQQLPRGCAQGIASDSVECFSRVIPQPGNYQLIVRASRDLQCGADDDCSCRPNEAGICTNSNVSSPDSDLLVFTFPTTSLFQSQTIEISAP